MRLSNSSHSRIEATQDCVMKLIVAAVSDWLSEYSNCQNLYHDVNTKDTCGSHKTILKRILIHYLPELKA